MRTTLEKKLIKPIKGEPFYIYKYTEVWRFKDSPFHLPHKHITFEEYDHLLIQIIVGYLNLERITEFIGISKEELIEDVRRKKHEINVE